MTSSQHNECISHQLQIYDYEPTFIIVSCEKCHRAWSYNNATPTSIDKPKTKEPILYVKYLSEDSGRVALVNTNYGSITCPDNGKVIVETHRKSENPPLYETKVFIEEDVGIRS